LQMFVEKPRDADMNHLRFFRKLAEWGAFGHLPLSVPRGDNVFRSTNKEIGQWAMQQADATRPDKLQRHIAIEGDY
jgi:hypothetical protein